MSANMREEIERILVQGFPDRPEVDVPFDFFSDAGKERLLSDEFGAECTERNAHRAVHVNDKCHRDSMRQTVSDKLLLGSPLYPADRAWIIYVLAKLKDMPHEAKGRATRSDEKRELALDLIAFMQNDRRVNPGRSIDQRLHHASVELNSKKPQSYSTLKNLYHSNLYKMLVKWYRGRGLVD